MNMPGTIFITDHTYFKSNERLPFYAKLAYLGPW